MIDQTFNQIVEALAAKSPSPGGGAASSLAGSLGAALILMAVRFAKGKPEAAKRENDLAVLEVLLEEHVHRLLQMAERDAAAFDRVAEAYRLPKETPDQQAVRRKAVQEAMRGAMVVPEEVMCMVRDLLVASSEVRDCIGKAIASDFATGSALLFAAAEGSNLNVRVNASYLDDHVTGMATLDRIVSIRKEIVQHHETIRDVVDRKLR